MRSHPTDVNILVVWHCEYFHWTLRRISFVTSSIFTEAKNKRNCYALCAEIWLEDCGECWPEDNGFRYCAVYWANETLADFTQGGSSLTKTAGYFAEINSWRQDQLWRSRGGLGASWESDLRLVCFEWGDLFLDFWKFNWRFDIVHWME